jgi:hypothetical protein
MHLGYKLAALSVAATTLAGGLGTVVLASTQPAAGAAWGGYIPGSRAWNDAQTPGGRAWNGRNLTASAAWNGARTPASWAWNGTRVSASCAWDGVRISSVTALEY